MISNSLCASCSLWFPYPPPSLYTEDIGNDRENAIQNYYHYY
jgi:hypothetical protein